MKNNSKEQTATIEADCLRSILEEERAKTVEITPRYKIKRRSNHDNSTPPSQNKTRMEKKATATSPKDYMNDNSKLLDEKTEEKARLRRIRFQKDQERLDQAKSKNYGFVSRGEDNRLQRSSKEREEFFHDILKLFIVFCNESSMGDEIRHFIEEEIEMESKVPDAGKGKVTIESILSSLRKLREALLACKPDSFTKKVFLFSIRVTSTLGHYQTYVPSILYLLNHQELLEPLELEEIASILILHTSHFNNQNARALEMCFKYLNPKETQTKSLATSNVYVILQAWIQRDYHTWIARFNTELNSSFIAILRFGITTMVKHTVKCISLSYYNLSKVHFEKRMLPNGMTYDSFKVKYDVSWQEQESQPLNLIIKKR